MLLNQSLGNGISQTSPVQSKTAILFPIPVRVFDPGLLLGDQALHELGPFLLVGFDTFVQQHFADLDSVGRRCATGLHKLGARSPVPLKTNADDNGRMGWSHARVKIEYKSSMAAIYAQIHPMRT